MIVTTFNSLITCDTVMDNKNMKNVRTPVPVYNYDYTFQIYCQMYTNSPELLKQNSRTKGGRGSTSGY